MTFPKCNPNSVTILPLYKIALPGIALSVKNVGHFTGHFFSTFAQQNEINDAKNFQKFWQNLHFRKGPFTSDTYV